MKCYKVVLYGGAMCEEPLAENIIRTITQEADVINDVKWIGVLDEGELASPYYRQAVMPNGDIYVDFGSWSRFVQITEEKGEK